MVTPWIILLVVAIYLLACLRILRQYERGVIFTLGRFSGVKEAGLCFVLVPFQTMERVSLRTITMQIPSQKIIAAVKLGEAADIIGQHPVALQLCTLQTMAEIATEKNSTIIFPAQFMTTVQEAIKTLKADSVAR